MLVTQSHFDDGSNNTLNLRRKNKKLFLSLAVLLLGLIACAGFVFANAQEGEDFEIKWIIPRENYAGNYFFEERAWVQKEKGGAWTLYDVEGNVIKNDFDADIVGPYENGFASFETDADKVGFVDISGDIVVPPVILNSGARLSEGLINERNEQRLYGFVDMSGAWVIPAEYGWAEAFSEGLAAVKKKGKWGYIDKRGTVVIDFVFDRVKSFANGSAMVLQNSKYGMIDNKGTFIVEPVYDEDFLSAKDNLIGVVRDAKVGFINRSGDVVIDFKFPFSAKNIHPFHNGRAVVFLNADGKERAVIDEKGDVLFKIEDEILLFPKFWDDYLCGVKGEKFLAFDKNGKIFDISRYIDYPNMLLSTNNVFCLMPPTFRGINKVGYFVISR